MSDLSSNPLLQSWDTPHGIPPFDRVRAEHYRPAFEHAMQTHRAEVDAIAARGPTCRVAAVTGETDLLRAMSNRVARAPRSTRIVCATDRNALS